jgi:hypothetical protein
MILDILKNPVYVQEKVDGSQFSFGIDNEGTVLTRSKGADIYVETAQKLFKDAVDYVHSIKGLLTPGYTYRGEVLCKPKHNALAYDRVPRHNVVIFDVNIGEEVYMPYVDVLREAARLDLEVVPLLFQGMINSAEQLKEFLENPSFLGGQKIEGVVVKLVGYDQFGLDKKALMGKYVSEAFKEIHGGNWKAANPTHNEIVEKVALMYKTPARWHKSVQHLKEAGQLEDSPRDIGKLMKEVNVDVLKECEAEIKEELFKQAWPKIARIITAGLPEWYKSELLGKQFAPEEIVTQHSQEIL